MRPAFTTLIMRERDFLECTERQKANEALYFYYYLNGPKAARARGCVPCLLVSSF